MGELEDWDPAGMRISDADRHRVAELLREAAGEGRLDLDELDERLDAAYAAKTYAELVPITADLPVATLPGGQPVRRPSGAVRGPTHDSSIAIFSSCDRKGAWVIGPSHQAVALMGGITLDLRQAGFTAPETVIHASAVMGGIDVWVDAHTHVVVEGTGIMGAFDQARDRVPPELGPDSPVVRVKGFALMGAVTVQRKAPAGSLRRRFGRS